MYIKDLQKEIIQSFNNGKTPAQIVQDLNRRGFRTVKGRKFTVGYVHSLRYALSKGTMSLNTTGRQMKVKVATPKHSKMLSGLRLPFNPREVDVQEVNLDNARSNTLDSGDALELASLVLSSTISSPEKKLRILSAIVSK